MDRASLIFLLFDPYRLEVGKELQGDPVSLCICISVYVFLCVCISVYVFLCIHFCLYIFLYTYFWISFNGPPTHPYPSLIPSSPPSPSTPPDTFSVLKGKESKLRIVLNKADVVGAQELMRLYGTLLWNIAPLLKVVEPPRIYIGSFWGKEVSFCACEVVFLWLFLLLLLFCSCFYVVILLTTTKQQQQQQQHQFQNTASSSRQLLLTEEMSLVSDLHQAILNNGENKISMARRHAKMVHLHSALIDRCCSCPLQNYNNMRPINTFHNNLLH